jgi:hypothetical protein
LPSNGARAWVAEFDVFGVQPVTDPQPQRRITKHAFLFHNKISFGVARRRVHLVSKYCERLLYLIGAGDFQPQLRIVARSGTCQAPDFLGMPTAHQ